MIVVFNFKMATRSVQLLKFFTSSCGHVFQQFQPTRGFFTRYGGLSFQVTQSLRAEPPKKKKKTDPKQEQLRQHRYIKRLKKLQYKMGKAELKPVDELKIDKSLLDGSRKRAVPEISEEEREKRALLQKEWSKYRFDQHVKETQLIGDFLKSQDKALKELRSESEELYQQAIKVDNSLFPYEATGPTYTPPIKDFEKKALDGEYIDLTRQYK